MGFITFLSLQPTDKATCCWRSNKYNQFFSKKYFFFFLTTKPFPIVFGNFWATVNVWKFLAVLAKIKFPAIFLTDVSNYCEEQKIKLLINAYIKISRNLGGNFLDFFCNFLATFRSSSDQLSSVLRAQSGKTYWRPTVARSQSIRSCSKKRKTISWE